MEKKFEHTITNFCRAAEKALKDQTLNRMIKAVSTQLGAENFGSFSNQERLEFQTSVRAMANRSKELGFEHFKLNLLCNLILFERVGGLPPQRKSGVPVRASDSFYQAPEVAFTLTDFPPLPKAVSEDEAEVKVLPPLPVTVSTSSPAAAVVALDAPLPLAPAVSAPPVTVDKKASAETATIVSDGGILYAVTASGLRFRLQVNETVNSQATS